MAHTVELLLDRDLEARVEQAWEALAAAGLPSQARHPHPTNRPHVTIAVADDLGPDARAALAAGLSALPLPMRLDGLAVLGGRRLAVAWLVVPTADLLDLHRQVHRVTSPPAGAGELLRPDRWLPHVTLAARLAPSAAGAVVTALAGLGAATGTADRARSYDTLDRTTAPLRRAADPPA